MDPQNLEFINNLLEQDNEIREVIRALQIATYEARLSVESL